MRPSEVLNLWIKAFNAADVEALGDLYADDAVNHQTPKGHVRGKEAIKAALAAEFNAAAMTCLVENIFEKGEWAILEWKDPLGMHGCCFFWVVNDKIAFQRGYWDRLTFFRLRNLPVEE